MSQDVGPAPALEVSVTVPPGDYAAVGKGEGMNEVPPTGSTEPGLAKCVLVSTDDPATDTTRTSVQSGGGAEGPGGVIGLGTAALTNAMTFHLHNGGDITESCDTDASSLKTLRFENVVVMATRVGAAHP